MTHATRILALLLAMLLATKTLADGTPTRKTLEELTQDLHVLAELANEPDTTVPLETRLEILEEVTKALADSTNRTCTELFQVYHNMKEGYNITSRHEAVTRTMENKTMHLAMLGVLEGMHTALIPVCNNFAAMPTLK